MNNRSRRHHIVPQTLQKHFCDDDGQLWYAKKDEAGRFQRPDQRTPKGAFWQRDYYTVINDGAKSDEVEREFYGSLDNLIGAVIPKFINCLKHKRPPAMEAELERSMKLAVFHMLLRTPDFMDHDELAIGHEYLDGLVDYYDRRPTNKADLNRVLSEKEDPSVVRSYGRSIRNEGTLTKHVNSERELMKRKFKWVAAPLKHSFILSNQICIRIGNGGPNGLNNPESEIWMPISPKFSLVLVCDETGMVPNYSEIDRDLVRSMNLHAAQNSTAIASHSEKLIRSLTRR